MSSWIKTKKTQSVSLHTLPIVFFYPHALGFKRTLLAFSPSIFFVFYLFQGCRNTGVYWHLGNGSVHQEVLTGGFLLIGDGAHYCTHMTPCGLIHLSRSCSLSPITESLCHISRPLVGYVKSLAWSMKFSHTGGISSMTQLNKVTPKNLNLI